MTGTNCFAFQVSEQQRATDLFSEKVKRSPFSSSDKVSSGAPQSYCKAAQTYKFTSISFLGDGNLSL